MFAELIKFMSYAGFTLGFSKVYYLYILAMVPGAFGLSMLINNWKDQVNLRVSDYLLPLSFASAGLFLIAAYLLNPMICSNGLHLLGCGYLLLLISFFAFLARVISKRFLCCYSPVILTLGVILLLFAHVLAPMKALLGDLATLPLTLGYLASALALFLFMREYEDYGVKVLAVKHPSLLKPDILEKVKGKDRST